MNLATQQHVARQLSRQACRATPPLPRAPVRVRHSPQRLTVRASRGGSSGSGSYQGRTWRESGGDEPGSSSSFGSGEAASRSLSPSSWLAGVRASLNAKPVADAAHVAVAAALLPTLLWGVTWVFTGGMLTLANSSLAGMCALARALHPALPVRGVDYEDVAISIVKALQSNTDSPSTWARPGLWAPAWLLRWLMGSMFSLATASSGIAASLLPSQQWLTVCSASQALMYAACLLFMMPVGSALSALAGRAAAWARARKLPITLPALSLPKLSDTSLLALKLAGVVAWPCISAAAVLQPSLMAPRSALAGSFGVAALQVGVCSTMLVLVLAVAFSAGRFALSVARQQAGATGVQAFGLQVGLLCAAQAGLNVLAMGLSLASRQASAQQLLMPAVSTLILGRMAWSVWRLWRLDASASSLWLQVLSLAPPLPSKAPGSS